MLLAWGMAIWSLFPAQQHRVVHLAPQNAGVLLGLFSCALYVGITLGSLLGGLEMRVARHPEFVLPLTSAALAAAALLAVAAETQVARSFP